MDGTEKNSKGTDEETNVAKSDQEQNIVGGT